MNSDLIITPADQWCREQFEGYEIATQSLVKLQETIPLNGSIAGTIQSAKLKRAKRFLEVADAKANAAEFVRILTQATPMGEILIDIPGVDIKVRIKW
jgi:hypothetical protein